MKERSSFFVPSSKKLNLQHFFKAAAKGDTALLRKYAKSHSVNEKDTLGRTALHVAALHSQERSIRSLLALGVDPQASDSQNWTALHAACSVGNTEIVDILLDTFEERHCLGKHFHHSKTQSVKVNISNHHSTSTANRINQKDLVECTPLHLACISGNCSVVRALVRKGAQISAKDITGRTPLEICKEKKNEELVDTLKQTTEGVNQTQS
jgi:ankyrin repeat protein